MVRLPRPRSFPAVSRPLTDKTCREAFVTSRPSSIQVLHVARATFADGVAILAFGRSVGRAPPTGTQRRLRAVPIRGLLKRRRSAFMASQQYNSNSNSNSNNKKITAGGTSRGFRGFRSCWRAGVGCRTPKSEFGVDVGRNWAWARCRGQGQLPVPARQWLVV
jgi:hypothetical protein